MNNEVYFDTEVLEYLEANGHARPVTLKNHLMKAHPDKRGYSEKNIDRKLANLKKSGQIRILKNPEDLTIYGIDKKDGRASYLISTRAFEIKEHLDRVIRLIASKDKTEKKEALIELENYEQKYVLSPNQLDFLVHNLDNGSINLDEHLLRILYKYIANKGKEPNNRDAFVNKLRILLERYPEANKKYKNLRTQIIHLLGYYNDEAVIEQLKKDVRLLNNSNSLEDESVKYAVKDYYYGHDFTARIIEKHRDELFDYIVELRKEGNDTGAQLISEIRYKALILLGIVEDSFKPDDTRDW